MIYEHEIPKRSRLYFGKSAKLKREIEDIASKILSAKGFEEIVTPYLSYHQHQSIDEKELIRFSDEKNHILSLRADSTLDVVRLITKRLGRSTTHKKWFYIQPVFRYPSSEYYQIGAERIGSSDLGQSINICAKIFDALKISPILHISNINIPKLISKELSLPIEVFKNTNLEQILKMNIPWLTKLAYIQKPSQMSEIDIDAPENIKKELLKMQKLSQKIEYKNVLFSPLFYAKMRYYDDLFFRFIDKNATLGMGGSYKDEDLESVGFALYTDALIEKLIKLKEFTSEIKS